MHELEHILLSWQHWVFEGVSDVALALLAYPVAKWRVRAHDKKVHSRGVQQ